MIMNYDVEIKILGEKNPIIVTEPFTPEGGKVFGAKHHPMIGAFMFWTKDGDPRQMLQEKANQHGLSVRWT